MVRIQHHFDLWTGNRVEQFERVVKRREKRPLVGATGMHGLDGQRDAQLLGLRGQFHQRTPHQSLGVIVRVSGARTAVDDQRLAAQVGGGLHGLDAVVDALAVTAAVAAGESTGPRKL